MRLQAPTSGCWPPYLSLPTHPLLGQLQRRASCSSGAIFCCLLLSSLLIMNYACTQTRTLIDLSPPTANPTRPGSVLAIHSKQQEAWTP